MRACRLGRPQRAIRRALVFLFAMLCLLAAVAAVASAAGSPAPAAAPGASPAGRPLAQDPAQGQQIFQTRCTSCHTIGKGKLVGPDLQGVTQRQDKQWIHNFILDPAKMIAAKDPIALQLLAQYTVQMPTLGLSPAEVDSVIAYLAQAGGTGGGQAAQAAPAAAAVPLPPGDPAVGQRLFTGQQRLAAGGPPCITCHSVSGTGALGGGALGPDLTHVSQRYTGATGLTPVLTTIAFPTMAGPFTGHALTPTEVADLVAFFVQQDTAQPPVAQITPGTLSPNFWRVLTIGLVGGGILILLLIFFWPRQRLSISERLRRTARTGKLMRDRNA